MNSGSRALGRWLAAVLCAALSIHAALAWGGVPGASGADEAARIQRLEQGFRCLVCQNETLADSTADLAADLRGKIAEQVAAGATDAQIRAYMTKRYGDFVLYDPPFKPLTWLLWLGPFVLLVAGALVFARIVAGRRAMRQRPLTPDERARVQALLGEHARDAGS
jgi:cytochrome c-type biogenesis protein CcmH